MAHPFLLGPSLHYFSAGISDHRLAKCKICIPPGGRVQCSYATSNFNPTFLRARETWQHCPRIRRAYRCLARGIPWRAGGHQSLSHLPRSKFERGKRGTHTVCIGSLISNTTCRFCGSGCPRGGDYPMKTSYRFAA